jgi:FtsH-binding integral membrane protein
MDGATMGLIGGIAGTVIGIAGAVFGCWRSYRNAENVAQRAFLRRVYLWTALGGTVFVTLIWATSLGLLPRWVYWVTMAAVFVPLGFWIRWMNRRLAELSTAANE